MKMKERESAQSLVLYDRSSTLKRRLYVRSSQIPNYPESKQCAQDDTAYVNRAVVYGNPVQHEQQLRSVERDG